MENSKIKIGDKVLIFESDPKVISSETKLKIGTIKNVEVNDKYKMVILTENFTQTSKSLDILMCTVLGEDGKEYYGSYDFYVSIQDQICFLTIEDYKRFLYKKMSENDNKKLLLTNENNLITEKLVELLKLKQNQKHNFVVLAVPNDKAFVVSSEKSEEFLNSKQSKEDKEFVEKLANKFKINNLVDDKGPILKKTKKKDN